MSQILQFCMESEECYICIQEQTRHLMEPRMKKYASDEFRELTFLGIHRKTHKLE